MTGIEVSGWKEVRTTGCEISRHLLIIEVLGVPGGSYVEVCNPF